VEISSDTPEIVDFVSLNNIERKVNPPKALIALNVKSDLELADWNLTATQENSDKQLIKQGVNNPPNEIEWAFSSIQNATKDMRSILNVSFVVSDVKGNKGSASASITPISILTIDKKASEGIDDYTIDEYRLILFDFNSSNISGENKAIVDLIKSNVKPDSEIKVTGHTDRTGDDNYNKKLSQNRADNVSRSIGHKNISAVGMGEENLLLDNNTPEARFYCRTVIVEVKTKK
jgi:outer membrane protein OmpA-like peptidoglycan-associated protein